MPMMPRPMSQMTVAASPRQRVMTFLAEFREAANDADLEIRIGKMETGAPAVVVSLNDKKHGFTAKEARTLADIAEAAMNECADDPESATLPNLIMALRLGADKAEQTR